MNDNWIPSINGIEFGYYDPEEKEFHSLPENNITQEENDYRIKHLRNLTENPDLNEKGQLSSSKILSVSNISVAGSFRGCGPVAGTNIIKYWGNKGYPRLTSGKTDFQIYDSLEKAMNTGWLPPDNWFVLPSDFSPGIQYYFNINWYEADAVRHSISSSSSYTTIISEVNASRPYVILYKSEPEYGQHYVTGVGYYTDNENDWYYINDGWGRNARLRDWNYDNPYLWYLFTIRPR